MAAGSVSVGVWNYYSSNFGKKSYTLTIPAVVKIIKITGTGFDGWSDESTDSAYVGTSGKTEQSGNTVIQYGNGSFTKYVGVTAGKSYTLYGRWIKDAFKDWIYTQNGDEEFRKYKLKVPSLRLSNYWRERVRLDV